jgi:hypothetical protein
MIQYIYKTNGLIILKVIEQILKKVIDNRIVNMYEYAFYSMILSFLNKISLKRNFLPSGNSSKGGFIPYSNNL